MPSRRKSACERDREKACEQVRHPCPENPFVCRLRGPRGLKGKSGSLLDYAEFFTSLDNPADNKPIAIAPSGDKVPFLTNGVNAGGGFIARDNSSGTFNSLRTFLLSPATYRITWTIPVTIRDQSSSVLELQVDGQDVIQTGLSTADFLMTRTVLCKINQTAPVSIINPSPTLPVYIPIEVDGLVISYNIVIECIAGP